MPRPKLKLLKAVDKELQEEAGEGEADFAKMVFGREAGRPPKAEDQDERREEGSVKVRAAGGERAQQ